MGLIELSGYKIRYSLIFLFSLLASVGLLTVVSIWINIITFNVRINYRLKNSYQITSADGRPFDLIKIGFLDKIAGIEEIHLPTSIKYKKRTFIVGGCFFIASNFNRICNIELKYGRFLREGYNESVISERLATHLFGKHSALNKMIQWVSPTLGETMDLTIVGVIKENQYNDIIFGDQHILVPLQDKKAATIVCNRSIDQSTILNSIVSQKLVGQYSQIYEHAAYFLAAWKQSTLFWGFYLIIAMIISITGTLICLVGEISSYIKVTALRWGLGARKINAIICSIKKPFFLIIFAFFISIGFSSLLQYQFSKRAYKYIMYNDVAINTISRFNPLSIIIVILIDIFTLLLPAIILSNSIIGSVPSKNIQMEG